MKNVSLWNIISRNSIHPSSEDLLKKALNHARTFVDISSGEEKTIMHCRKFFTFQQY